MSTPSQRVTHQINRKPAANIHHATKYATDLGCPLNTFVTINLSALGIETTQASHQLQKLIAQRFCPWLRRLPANDNSTEPTYVWSIEAAGGQIAVHWVLHVPSKLKAAFQERLQCWLSQISLEPPTIGAVCIKRVTNIVGLKRYILKGTDAHYARCIQISPVAQGVVIGKRTGFSRNLGPTARRAGGYTSKHFRVY